MLRLKNFVAIMIVALAASFSAPQAFAGDMQYPGVAGDMSGPGLAGDILTPPGRAGEMPIVGITGEIGFPGLDGQMEFPVAGSIWAIIAGLF